MSLFALARHHPRRLFIIYPSAVEISRPSDQRDYFWIHAEKRVIYITCTLCSVALFVPVDHSPIYYTLSLERCICGEEQLHRYRLLSEIEIVAFKKKPHVSYKIEEFGRDWIYNSSVCSDDQLLAIFKVLNIVVRERSSRRSIYLRISRVRCWETLNIDDNIEDEIDRRRNLNAA